MHSVDELLVAVCTRFPKDPIDNRCVLQEIFVGPDTTLPQKTGNLGCHDHLDQVFPRFAIGRTFFGIFCIDSPVFVLKLRRRKVGPLQKLVRCGPFDQARRPLLGYLTYLYLQTNLLYPS